MSNSMPDPIEYKMIISRNTVDKLGIKMYDKVSAVVAELVSNSYDADAEKVVISGPMSGGFLATKKDGRVISKDVSISVKDNGHGMTPEEMQTCFLVVGRDRRRGGGDCSHKKKRKVMGRKGVGKLAPFGICKTIEIISSGGCKVFNDDKEGYLTSHIVLKLQDIIGAKVLNEAVSDEPYRPEKGKYDNTLRNETGTEIILKDFEYKKMLAAEEMANQLSQRFGIKQPDWSIELCNTSISPPKPTIVGGYTIECKPSTKIIFKTKEEATTATDNEEGCSVKDENENEESLRAGFYHDGRFYPVAGWVGYSKNPHRDELMVGVRIYCRGKIAAQTPLFNCRSGFAGEHTVRSYLVGELHADWLDEEDDLVVTDRRSIHWSNERVATFEEWGQGVVKYLAKKALDPVKKEMEEKFLRMADFEKKVLERYPNFDQKPLVNQAKKLCKLIGGSFSPEQLENSTLVNSLAELCLAFAPHVEFEKQMQAATGSETTLDLLVQIIKTAEVAENFSLGKLVKNRIGVIKKLEDLKNANETNESQLQELIESAIWLVNPQWTAITNNCSLNTFKTEFETFYNNKNPESPIRLGRMIHGEKRPDFIMYGVDKTLQIIEIKRPSHKFSDEECDRLMRYIEAFKAFGKENKGAAENSFSKYHITLVCDGDLDSLEFKNKELLENYSREKTFQHISWTDFLFRTKKMHEEFLSVAYAVNKANNERVDRN